MSRLPTALRVYPFENYKKGMKGPLFEKDTTVKDRMARMEQSYYTDGMRRHVEALMFVHKHGHLHLLIFQIGNTFFKLPGGRVRGTEPEKVGLLRKLNHKLGCKISESTMNWKVGDLLAQWFRPNFETVLFPYLCPHVSKPKECRKMYLIQLPVTGVFGIPKNLKLLCVPLFELYENAHRYGSTISSVAVQMSRVRIIICDRDGSVISDPLNDFSHEKLFIREFTKTDNDEELSTVKSIGMDEETKHKQQSDLPEQKDNDGDDEMTTNNDAVPIEATHYPTAV